MKLAPSLNCDIQYTEGFRMGKGPLADLSSMEESKIGLNPRGNSVETSRLSEYLVMGTVPAMLDHKYVHAPFELIPAILGKSWDELAIKIQHVIDDDIQGGETLYYSQLTRAHHIPAAYTRILSIIKQLSVRYRTVRTIPRTTRYARRARFTFTVRRDTVRSDPGYGAAFYTNLRTNRFFLTVED